MKILVLGGNGTLGHKLVEVLSTAYEVHTSVRKRVSDYRWIPAPSGSIVEGLDVLDDGRLRSVMKSINPDVIVNAVGVIKQREASPFEFMSVNSLFPYRLNNLCHGVRLIHISTDCVYSGSRGNYIESDEPDPVDVYGLSKWMGEICACNALTLRTSLVGWQIQDFNNLFSWFVQEGVIKGYKKAIFSGLTTRVFSELILYLIAAHPQMIGTFHVASQAISKFDLLCGLRDALGFRIAIEPDDSFVCDRSLWGDAFSRETHWTAPIWEKMLEGIAGEWPHYEPLYKER